MGLDDAFLRNRGYFNQIQPFQSESLTAAAIDSTSSRPSD